MAIDVLSEPDSVAIIVGDAPDMSALEGIVTDSDGQSHLRLNGQQVTLSESASANLQTVRHLLLVSLEQDRVVTARRVRIDDLANGHDLSTEERDALAKALTLTSDPASRKFYNAAIAEFKSRFPDLAAA